MSHIPIIALTASAMPLLNSSSPVVRDEAPPALDVDLSLFREDFRNEARACLSAMWTFAGAANLAAVAGAARAAHTLKGSAAMMGYSDGVYNRLSVNTADERIQYDLQVKKRLSSILFANRRVIGSVVHFIQEHFQDIAEHFRLGISLQHLLRRTEKVAFGIGSQQAQEFFVRLFGLLELGLGYFAEAFRTLLHNLPDHQAHVEGELAFMFVERRLIAHRQQVSEDNGLLHVHLLNKLSSLAVRHGGHALPGLSNGFS